MIIDISKYSTEQLINYKKQFEKCNQYDFTVYSIVQYFRLAMDNNPNIVDSLFVPATCVLHSTNIGQRIRENRKIFLHKGIYHRLKGYSFSQLNKIETNKSAASESRKELVEKYGYDTKYAMHLFRLILQCEDVLVHGDLDLQRHREQLKAVRRGHYKIEEIRQWFSDKERSLEKLYTESTALPYSPNEAVIKQLLLDCLEEHYGSIEKSLYSNEEIKKIIDDIEDRLILLKKALL